MVQSYLMFLMSVLFQFEGLEKKYQQFRPILRQKKFELKMHLAYVYIRVRIFLKNKRTPFFAFFKSVVIKSIPLL